jgi:hypothetical protein
MASKSSLNKFDISDLSPTRTLTILSGFFYVQNFSGEKSIPIEVRVSGSLCGIKKNYFFKVIPLNFIFYFRLSITTREELDEFEPLNIEKAMQWTFGKKIHFSHSIATLSISSLKKRPT